MLKIVKERTPETITEYYIEFTCKDDPNAGFCFPATKEDKPNFFQMCNEAHDNYNRCLVDKALDGPEFITNTRTYINPAVGRCSCGSLVTLDSDYMGAVRCECGRWYNIFGQSLKDPKYWEEDYEY